MGCVPSSSATENDFEIVIFNVVPLDTEWYVIQAMGSIGLGFSNPKPLPFSGKTAGM